MSGQVKRFCLATFRNIMALLAAAFLALQSWKPGGQACQTMTAIEQAAPP
jgi:hypothetical protein